MSADNGIFIRKQPNGKFKVFEAFMSTIDEHDDWIGAEYNTRAEALEAAHDLANQEYTEYGVIEL